MDSISETGIFTLAGASFGVGATVVVTLVRARVDRVLQQDRFEREARKARYATIPLLKDMFRYVEAAARFGSYDGRKWRSTLALLLSRAADSETTLGFSEEQWFAIADAIAETRLVMMRLRDRVGSLDPFEYPRENADDPLRLNDDRGLIQTQIQYVATVRRTAHPAYDRFAKVFALLGESKLPPLGLNRPSIVAAVIERRGRIAQLHPIREDDPALFGVQEWPLGPP